MSSYLVTGGTGALGQAMTRTLLADPATTRVVVFSRSEEKQREMATSLGADPRDRLRFFLGDVRDYPRLVRAMSGCETVIHAAALKQIDAVERDPAEAVKTNVTGTMNVCDAALDVGCVKRVVVISSDKATSPSTTYGASKAVAERLAVNSNAYSGATGPRICCVRYGNVANSTGSVIPVWRKQAMAGQTLKLFGESMSRYWFDLPGAVAFVRDVITRTRGGEVWIPKLPSFRVDDLRMALCPTAGWERHPVRPFEKLYEEMVSEHEAPLTWAVDDYYAICPPVDGPLGNRVPEGAARVPDGFVYRSDRNERFLSVAELRELVAAFVGKGNAA